MSLKLVSRVADLAVDLEDIKAHLRVDDTTEDALIESMVIAATESAEQIIGKAISTQTWELVLDSFPDGIELTRVPVASVTSIKYIDTNGVEQTLSPTAYRLRATDDYGSALIVPAYNTQWPETQNDVDTVSVMFVAGYANTDAVPEPIKAWIKLHVGAMYENREAESYTSRTTVVKMAFVDGLLDRYKVYV